MSYYYFSRGQCPALHEAIASVEVVEKEVLHVGVYDHGLYPNGRPGLKFLSPKVPVLHVIDGKTEEYHIAHKRSLAFPHTYAPVDQEPEVADAKKALNYLVAAAINNIEIALREACGEEVSAEEKQKSSKIIRGAVVCLNECPQEELRVTNEEDIYVEAQLVESTIIDLLPPKEKALLKQRRQRPAHSR